MTIDTRNTTFFDLETDGLLADVSLIHCLGYAYGDRAAAVAGGNGIYEMTEAWRLRPPTLIGHNIIGYDLPVLEKLRGYKHRGGVIDTLVLARLVFADTREQDTKLMLAGKLPGRLLGSHSLEAWGIRLGIHKGEFKGPWKQSEVEAAARAELGIEDADDEYGCGPTAEQQAHIEARVAAWKKEMREYCAQDVEVTKRLYAHCMAQEPSQEAIELEHAVQTIIQRQVRRGIVFDIEKATVLRTELMDALAPAEAALLARYSGWYAPVSPDPTKAVKVPARDNKTRGYTAGVPFTAIKFVAFNPGSGPQRVKVLMDAGWVPEKFTDKGNPKLDDEVLQGIDLPGVAEMRTYLLINKRLGQLSDGKEGWYKHIRNGRIHGSINTCGAVTGRMTHSAPNLAQVPKVAKGKEGVLRGAAGGWGYECRELFTATAGWVLVGCDASGLELRMLAHFMGRYDGCEYAKLVVGGDIHSANQASAGLPTRDNAKTFIYGFL